MTNATETRQQTLDCAVVDHMMNIVYARVGSLYGRKNISGCAKAFFQACHFGWAGSWDRAMDEIDKLVALVEEES